MFGSSVGVVRNRECMVANLMFRESYSIGGL